MAVFIGASKNTEAVQAALRINWAMHSVVTEQKNKLYSANKYVPKHVVGIDSSDLFVVKTGVRGANDLVWVGRAANHAAKLSSLPETYRTYITASVYDVMADSVKHSNPGGENMWVAQSWEGRSIYGSTYRRPMM